MSGVDARCLGEACVWCARWGSHSHKTTNNKMCTETEAFNRSDVTEPEIAPRGIGVKIHRESLTERRKDQRRRQSQAQGHKGHRRFQATGATCRVRIAKRPRQLLAGGLPGDLIRGYCRQNSQRGLPSPRRSANAPLWPLEHTRPHPPSWTIAPTSEACAP